MRDKKSVERGAAQLDALPASAPILSPADPMPSAALYVHRLYMNGDHKTLHCQNGTFYKFGGTHYVEHDDATIRAELWNFLNKAQRRKEGKDGKSELVPYQPTTSRVSNVMDATRAVVHLPMANAAPCWLDSRTDPAPVEILACGNGLVHLPTGTIEPSTPNFFTLSAVPYDFDAQALEPKAWIQFLTQLWPDDAQSIATLQEWFGYLLTSDTTQQKILLMVGPKRSGKGTIARVLTALLGAVNVAGPTLSSLSQNFGLQPLIGKLLAIVADARLGGRADQQVIAERLLSISGEDGITVDRKFKDAWTGKLSARFMILSNELPRLADASGALASRFLVLSLNASFFGKEDVGLTQRLMAELPAILNWAVQGWRQLKERGHFQQPESAQDAIQELYDLGSPISVFVRDCCRTGPECEVSIDLLFRTWQDWCNEQGREHPGTKQTFGRDLRAALPQIDTAQPRADGKRDRIYTGITLGTQWHASQTIAHVAKDEDLYRNRRNGVACVPTRAKTEIEL